jgi:hypothetical protein
MARPIHPELLTDLFNKIGHEPTYRLKVENRADHAIAVRWVLI